MSKKTLGIVLICALQALSADAQERRGVVRAAARPIPEQYIVVLATGEDPDVVGRESELLHRGRLKHVYRQALRGFAIRLNPQAAAALAADPRVSYIEQDGTVEIVRAQANPPWGLDRIDQRALPLDAFYYDPSSTNTVYVHVIDTGIRVSHTEFGGRASIAADYLDDDGDGDPSDVGNDDGTPAVPDGADCNGHGTHVAGTIGGSTYGVAKFATLLAHRVLNCAGSGATSGVIAALDAVAGDARRPAVTNLSLGAGPSQALDAAVRRAIAAGVTVVVAAGNESLDASTTSPARVSEAITVGATNTADARASFSNFGAVLDLFAPGAGIVSAWYTSNTAAATLSGTSMAAPHTTGVAALYLQAFGHTAPATVRDAIVGAATVGAVSNPGAGSPNALLYSGFIGGTGSTPEITTPARGATLTGSTQTFTWTSGTASRFWLYVGSSAGGNDLFNRDLGSNLTVTVSGLPADGRTLHARLWWIRGGGWESADYQYTASSTGGSGGGGGETTTTVPQLTMPTAGTTLAGSTQQFQWSAGTGVSRYWLSVGSTPAGSDLFDRDQGTNLTVTINGLPTDGRTLHVRLWWIRNGTWESGDYQYTAATGGGGGGGGGGTTPQLTTPAPGATLAGATQQFQWSAGTGVSKYWLSVGTRAGGSDLFDQDLGTNRTVTVTGLPTDGRTLYVRLWWVGSSWQSADYTYTAARLTAATLFAGVVGF